MPITDKFEIIDFHMHPQLRDDQNTYYYKDILNMSCDTTLKVMDELGISKFCGRVLNPKLPDDAGREARLKRLRDTNDSALELTKIYGDRYVPGFLVTPTLVKESCEEIERIHKLGYNLIGELTPYMDGWVDMYTSKEWYEILELAAEYDMLVSIHDEHNCADEIDKMISDNKNVNFVIAHPSAFTKLDRNIARMKMSERVCIDLSGNGMTYNGIARHLVNSVGKERVLYGSDYPICSIGAFAGAVVFDPFLTDDEKEHILALNAKRLLKI